MFLSIITPHRDRNRQFRQLCWSIERSARASGISGYEVILVDHCSDQLPRLPAKGRCVVCVDPFGVLNKNRLLNIGIEMARGKILSFLDADMLVGKYWMGRTLQRLGDNAPQRPTRLAYRVRQLKIDDNAHQNTDLVLGLLKEQRFSCQKRKEAFLDGWFGEYENFTRGFEAYGRPEAGWHPITGDPKIDWPVFGNSQFSIRRDVLGDLRFDESFEGAGYEDIGMAWAIQKQAGLGYRGEILTDAEYALLHIWHGPRVETDLSYWAPKGVSQRNQERYGAMVGRRL